MTWTEVDGGHFEAKQDNIKLWATNGSTGPAWAVSLDGGEVMRTGSANSLQGAMLKAKHAAQELGREFPPRAS